MQRACALVSGIDDYRRKSAIYSDRIATRGLSTRRYRFGARSEQTGGNL